jgi:hypothetical protein
MNNAKTIIECEFILDDGSVQRAVINKEGTAEDGADNPDWAWVHEESTTATIEENTKKKIIALRQKEADVIANNERRAGEELFNFKLKVFEMEEIRASKNTKMKAKIRRGDDMLKVNVYAAALVAMEMMEPAGIVVADMATPQADETTPVKKPRKKATAKKKTRIVDTIKDDKREK